MVKIIAEIGWNHMGEMSLAKKMIKSAAVNGADMVKLQTWSEKNLKTGPWDNDGRREIYKKAELHQSDYLNLKKFSKKTKFLVDEFSKLSYKGTKLNGKLTLGENIADLGGVTMAYYALIKKNPKNIKHFFENFANVEKILEENW